LKYEIRTYGSAVLRKKAVPVTKIDDSIKQLAKDMLQTLYKSNGLGLAAEQIGRTESICVIDVPPAVDVEKEGGPRLNPSVRMPLVMLNPEIVEMVGTLIAQEGCLSFPEIFVNVKRAAEITVRFKNLAGKEEVLRAVGLLARAVQHEVDHLNGVLLVDRMSPVQRVTMAGKLRKLKKSNA
jgi:peptide deformylase